MSGAYPPNKRSAHTGALHGRALFLSASIPAKERALDFRRIPDAPREIEQAVVSLADAVFAEGGRLVFGGHPSISPLIALVASKYAPAGAAELHEPLVTVHQLDVFRQRGEIPDATSTMERLGYARIVWHETDLRERDRQWAQGEIRFPKSLRSMREAMLGHPVLTAMVCIGGMEGVLEEAELFARSRRGPVFALARTGGAAALLAGEGRPSAESTLRIPNLTVDVIDHEVLDGLTPMLLGPDGERRAVPLRYTPYPLVMREMVRRLAGGNRG